MTISSLYGYSSGNAFGAGEKTTSSASIYSFLSPDLANGEIPNPAKPAYHAPVSGQAITPPVTAGTLWWAQNIAQTPQSHVIDVEEIKEANGRQDFSAVPKVQINEMV